MRKRLVALSLVGIIAAALLIPGPVAQVTNALTRGVLQNAASIFTLAGEWIFSGKVRLPNSTTLPAGDCSSDPNTVGRVYVDTDATSGQQVYVCEGAAGWVLQGAPTGPDPSNEITVCDSGCDATLPCGTTTRATPDNTACAAGSAVELARTLRDGGAEHVLIRVLPGRYDDVVALNDITDVTLWIMPGAIIRPIVSAAADVDGGVIRVGDDATTRGADNIWIVVDGIVQNDAFSAPESGIQVGREACADEAKATWGNVHITGSGTVIGHHDSVQWCSDRRDSATATDQPSLRLSHILTIGGRDNVVKKGNSIDYMWGGMSKTITNYCETSDEMFLVAVSGTAQAGEISRVTLEAADNFGAVGGYVGRTITFSDNGGGCGATNACDGHEGTVTDFGAPGFENVVTFSPSCSEAITTGCNYTISAVGEYEVAPCRDVDWTIIASGGFQFGWWKLTWLHFGVTGTDLSQDADLLHVSNWTGETRANDFATRGGANCVGTASQAGCLAGILSYATEFYKRAIFDNVISRVVLNTEVGDLTVVSAVAINGNLEQADFTGRAEIINNADTDNDLAVFNVTDAQGALRVWRADVDIVDNASSSGTMSYLRQTAGTLIAGDVRSPTSRAAIGTIGGLRKGLTGSLTEDIGVVTTCLDSTGSITVTGAAFGDTCSVTTSVAPTAGQAVTCKVTAADTVKVNVCGAGDPPSTTYTVSVEKK